MGNTEQRAIEYAIATSRKLTESLEDNDGFACGLLRKLQVMLDACNGECELDRVIDLAIGSGFDAAECDLDPDQWTRDELVTFARASVGMFD